MSQHRCRRPVVRPIASRSAKKPRDRHLVAELLEDRIAPALVGWDGGAATSNWLDRLNWEGDRLPGTADEAVVGPAFAAQLIRITGNVSVKQFTSAAPIELTAGSFVLGAGTSTLNATVTVQPGSTLDLYDSVLAGAGPVVNRGLVQLGRATINPPVQNQGQIGLLYSGTSTINGALTTSANSSIRVSNFSGFELSNIVVASGFTNFGTIDLFGVIFSRATLTVSSGTLVNALTGSIRAVNSSGGRSLNAQVDNQGVILVESSLGITNSGRTFTSINGRLDIAANRSLTVDGGTTVFGLGTVFAGNGPVNLTGTQELRLSSDLTLPAGAPRLNLAGVVTVNGPGRLINRGTLTVAGAVVNAPLLNQGALIVSSGTTTINGPLTTLPGSAITVQPNGSSGTFALTVANGFTNFGTMELVGGGFTGSYLTISSGSLTNAPAGVIRARGNGTKQITAQIVNQGLLSIDNSLTVSQASASHTNSGIIRVNGDDLKVSQSGTNVSFINTGTIQLTGGHLLLGQAGTGATFTNDGTVDVSAGRFFAFSGGRLTNLVNGVLTGGVYEVAGELQIPDMDVRTNAAMIVLDGAGKIVNQSRNDALRLLGGNAAAGSLTLRNGRTLSLSGTVQTSFAPAPPGGLAGVAQDPATGDVFVYHGTGSRILRFTQAGVEVGAGLSVPLATTDRMDLDFLTEPAVIGGTSVPAGVLLVFNQNTRTLQALDKGTAAVLGTVSLSTSSLVGGAYHSGRDTVFVVNSVNDRIDEVDPATGAVLNSFPVAPTSSPAFDVNAGDVDVDQATGNLFVVGSSQARIRELTADGTFVRDIDVTALGVGNLAGLEVVGGGAFWLTNSSSVFLISAGFTNAGVLTLGTGTRLSLIDFSQPASGRLNVVLGGSPASGQFGRLSVAGQATLGGKLVVDLAAGFGLTAGHSYS